MNVCKTNTPIDEYMYEMTPIDEYMYEMGEQVFSEFENEGLLFGEETEKQLNTLNYEFRYYED